MLKATREEMGFIIKTINKKDIFFHFINYITNCANYDENIVNNSRLLSLVMYVANNVNCYYSNENIIFPLYCFLLEVINLLSSEFSFDVGSIKIALGAILNIIKDKDKDDKENFFNTLLSFDPVIILICFSLSPNLFSEVCGTNFYNILQTNIECLFNKFDEKFENLTDENIFLCLTNYDNDFPFDAYHPNQETAELLAANDQNDLQPGYEANGVGYENNDDGNSNEGGSEDEIEEDNEEDNEEDYEESYTALEIFDNPNVLKLFELICLDFIKESEQEDKECGIMNVITDDNKEIHIPQQSIKQDGLIDSPNFFTNSDDSDNFIHPLMMNFINCCLIILDDVSTALLEVSRSDSDDTHVLTEALQNFIEKFYELNAQTLFTSSNMYNILINIAELLKLQGNYDLSENTLYYFLCKLEGAEDDATVIRLINIFISLILSDPDFFRYTVGSRFLDIITSDTYTFTVIQNFEHFSVYCNLLTAIICSNGVSVLKNIEEFQTFLKTNAELIVEDNEKLDAFCIFAKTLVRETQAVEYDEQKSIEYAKVIGSAVPDLVRHHMTSNIHLYELSLSYYLSNIIDYNIIPDSAKYLSDCIVEVINRSEDEPLRKATLEYLSQICDDSIQDEE